MKEWSGIFRQITMLSQLGLSLVVPVFMCLGVCYLLNTRLGAGTWIYIPGFILGLGASATTAWKFYQNVMHREKKSGKKGTSFNNHL